MKYAKHRSSMTTKTSSGKGRWLIIVALLAAIAVIVGVVLGGGSDDPVVDEVLVDEMDVLVEIEEETTDEDVVIDTESWTQEIALEDEEGTGGSGIARRGVSGELFTHVVVAELPAINEETTFYEGWLVIPGVVEFFSTGEMFPREDGKWGLVWEINTVDAELEYEDFYDYREVVITREPRDGDPAPAPAHVIEGIFDVYDVE